MNPWSVRRSEHKISELTSWVVSDGFTDIATTTFEAIAQDIVNEHNAWAIAAERKWSVAYSNYYQAWVVYDDHGKAVHWPMITSDNSPGKYDTPVAAILAAHHWLTSNVRIT